MYCVVLGCFVLCLIVLYCVQLNCIVSYCCYSTGESGVRVGFDGSQEPVLKEFGDLYANFLFSGSGGSMEV